TSQRNPRSRAILGIERLEDRTVPTTFTVIDTFSAATPGDLAVNSGGTGAPGNIQVTNIQLSDTGVDTAFVSTAAAPNPGSNPLGGSRNVLLQLDAALSQPFAQGTVQTQPGSASIAASPTGATEVGTTVTITTTTVHPFTIGQQVTIAG